MHNFRDIMDDLLRAVGAVQCKNSTEVEASITRFLQHPGELRELHARAATFMHDKGGVAERMLAQIKPWLDL